MKLTFSAGLFALLAGASFIGVFTQAGGSAAEVIASAVADPARPQNSAPTPAVHDGQHDFDFNIGVWTAHIKRTVDPFAAKSDTLELSGTVTVRKVWDGKAQLEEIEADGPKGHWEGLTLFLYNPAAHQWSQIFTNSKLAMMGTPLIGEFKEGRGELYATDTFNGRSVLIRGVWSDIMPNAHRFTESISADGGVTWFPTFIGELTRRAP